MTPAIPNKPHQTSCALDFLVIGGSSAGLSAAYALRRVGHRVLVLEQNADFFDVGFSLFLGSPSTVMWILTFWISGTSEWWIQTAAQHVKGLLSLGPRRTRAQILPQIQHDHLHSL